MKLDEALVIAYRNKDYVMLNSVLDQLRMKCGWTYRITLNELRRRLGLSEERAEEILEECDSYEGDE